MVEQLIDTASAENTEVMVMGLEGRPAITLRALNALREAPEDRLVPSIDEPRDIAQRLPAG